MTRPCPNCGAACATEARFCRLCGTPLRPYASGDVPVSPGARTVPLTDEGRTTNGLSSEDGSASAPETSRVRRAEMESILRRPAPTPSSLPAPPDAQSAFDEKEATAAPSTTSLAGASMDGKSTAVSSPGQESHAANGTHAAEASTVKSDENLRRGPQTSSAPARRGASRKWLVIVPALIVLVLGAVALALYFSGRTGARDAQGTGGPGGGDARRTVEERLAEAETLLASGNVTEAMARLRSVIRLEPANARAHRLLAEALERTGAVNEAIDEYRLAAQYDPGNEETQLRYADALRRVGRTDEAREIYQKLSTSSSEEVSRAAKEQLSALSSSASASNADAARSDDERTAARAETNGANTNNGTAQAPDSSSTRPGAPSSSTDGGGDVSTRVKARNDPVASYNTAMKIIEGKDIRKMNRAELIRAYELFQYAQSGPNAADATRRLQALDRELFERRKRKQ